MTRERTDIDGIDLSQPRSSFNLFHLILRRKWLVLVGVLVGLAGGWWHLRGLPIQYKGQVRILVISKAPNLPVAKVDTEIPTDDNLATHIEILRSPKVIDRAIKLRGLRFSTDQILERLKASPTTVNEWQNARDLLNISYTSLQAVDCEQVLDAVVASYAEFLEETYKDSTKEAMELFGSAAGDLYTQIQTKQKEYQQFRETTPLVGRDGRNMHEERSATFHAEVSRVRLSQIPLEARVEAIDQFVKEGNFIKAIEVIVGFGTVAGAQRRSAEQDLHQLDRMLRIFELLLQFGPDHPDVVREMKKKEYLENLLGKKGPVADQNVEANPKAALEALVRDYLDGQRLEIEIASGLEAKFQRLCDEEETKSKALANDMLRDEFLREQLEYHKGVFTAAMRRLDDIDLIRKHTGYKVELLDRVRPGDPVLLPTARVLSVAAFLGLLGGLVLAGLVELAEKTFYSPEEIRNQLNLPVIGHIPVIPTWKVKKDDKAGSLSPILWTAHRPKSQVAEAYRAIRTAMFYQAAGRPSTVIQVTSPEIADGKTTLAANLAISIAQAGKKTLLIDGDLRHPSLHKLFGIDRKPGFSGVINGETALADAVQPTGVDRLWIIPCGSKPPNPAEVLTSPRVDEILQKLRSQYDFIIIDTPPLLAVTDPSVVAPKVDGVLMTLRIRPRTRPKASHARELLEEINAKVLGVVVNGIGGEGIGRGGWSRYYYSRYYHAGYYGSYGGPAYKNYYYGDGEDAPSETADRDTEPEPTSAS